MSMRYHDTESDRYIVAAPEQAKRALNGHAAPTDALFLGMEVFSGDADDLTFDLTMSTSGQLVLTVKKGETTRREVFDTQELVRTWVGNVAAQIDSGNLPPLQFVWEDDGTPAPAPKGAMSA